MEQSKKTKKQPSQNNQAFRRLGVIMEHMDDKISLVAEQNGDIKKDYGDIKMTLDDHTEMIAKLTVNTEIVKTDVEFIKNSLKKKVDIDEFAALERRVALLEKHH